MSEDSPARADPLRAVVTIKAPGAVVWAATTEIENATPHRS
jgi:hypothetical protein